MKTLLPNGDEAQVFVHYGEVSWTHKGKTDIRRASTVGVKFKDGTKIEATAVCNPEDHFERKTGRFLATDNLAAKMREAAVPFNVRRHIVHVLLFPENYRTQKGGQGEDNVRS